MLFTMYTRNIILIVTLYWYIYHYQYLYKGFIKRASWDAWWRPYSCLLISRQHEQQNQVIDFSTYYVVVYCDVKSLLIHRCAATNNMCDGSHASVWSKIWTCWVYHFGYSIEKIFLRDFPVYLYIYIYIFLSIRF